jgi:hypothetical protein
VSTRQIKRKVEEIEQQFKEAVPKLTAWTSAEVLSSSQVPKLDERHMSSSEVEEAGVSSYSYTDPSELPAKIKLLSSLPQLEQELNEVQNQWEVNKKLKLSELPSPPKFEFVVALAVALAAVLSQVPQQVQLGVLASSTVVLGSWLGSCAVGLTKQLQLLTELQFSVDLKLAEIQKSLGWSFATLKKIEFSVTYREGNQIKLLLQVFDKLGYCEKRLLVKRDHMFIDMHTHQSPRYA